MANLADSQLFQSFPTEVTQNDSEWPILPDLQLRQSFPTEVAQNDSEQPILPNSQLFQSFPTEVAQNDLEQPISPDSQTKLVVWGKLPMHLVVYPPPTNANYQIGSLG